MNYLQSLQARVAPWMQECFGPKISSDKLERGDRLLEEVFELLQSGDYPQDRVLQLRDYVWSRPKGQPDQEVGGTMITLAAYCLAHGLNMHEAGERELSRINKPDVILKIRDKQALKAKQIGNSPLPQKVAKRWELTELGKKGLTGNLDFKPQQYLDAGWSPEKLVEHGYAKWVEREQPAWAVQNITKTLEALPKAQGVNLQEFLNVGWSVPGLIENGYFKVKEMDQRPVFDLSMLSVQVSSDAEEALNLLKVEDQELSKTVDRMNRQQANAWKKVWDKLLAYRPDFPNQSGNGEELVLNLLDELIEKSTIVNNDGNVLLYLHQQFQGENWDCPNCGHVESTRDCDSASYLKDYLKGRTSGVIEPTVEELLKMIQLNDVANHIIKMIEKYLGCKLKVIEGEEYQHLSVLLTKLDECFSLLKSKEKKYDAINTPEIKDFLPAVHNEALHQRERWGADGDAGKTTVDWYWLVAHLAGKALHFPEKRAHHIITTAAALLNWHAAEMGVYTNMRPGTKQEKV